jgi:hypothetical protein
LENNDTNERFGLELASAVSRLEKVNSVIFLLDFATRYCMEGFISIFNTCFIWRPSDSTVSEDVVEPRTVAMFALAARLDLVHLSASA